MVQYRVDFTLHSFMTHLCGINGTITLLQLLTTPNALEGLFRSDGVDTRIHVSVNPI